MTSEAGEIKARITKKNRRRLCWPTYRMWGRVRLAGEWFRRYWVVVGTAQELYDIPRAVKVLGEDLVLFRDQFGKVGLLGEHCPHRGASLEYGDIEDGGLRCPYHGWLFNVERPVFGDAGGAEGQ